MAKAFSFDVVSEVDLAEVTNAVDQARREIVTRFDFKNTGTSLEQDEDLVEFRSSTESRLKAAVDVFKDKCVRRQVPLKALAEGPILPAAKGTYRQTVNIRRRQGQGAQQVHPRAGNQGADSGPGPAAAGDVEVERRPSDGDRGPQGPGLRHPAAVHELPVDDPAVASRRPRRSPGPGPHSSRSRGRAATKGWPPTGPAP
jgi:hypothetical protein